MKTSFVMLVLGALLAACPARGEDSADAPSVNRRAQSVICDEPVDADSDSLAELRFAPMWIPVPNWTLPDSDSEATLESASSVYEMIWQPKCQQQIGLSDEQQTSLLAINAKGLEESKRQIDEFKSLPRAEQDAQVKGWAGEPAPWRRQLNRDIRTRIEAVLTPEQLQALKELSFPQHAIELLYEPKIRQEILFSPMQEEELRRTIRERLSRFQEEYLQRADRIWDELSPRQRAELPELVKHQGPTSAALSIAWELGFDMDALALSYPLLAETPVRARLRLTPDQQTQLQTVMTNIAAKHDAAGADKRRVESILTPQQLTTVKQIDFRRRIALAMGYPDKRAKIGVTDQQQSAFERIDKETSEQLRRIDPTLLAQALSILTPRQQEQLREEMERRGWRRL